MKYNNLLNYQNRGCEFLSKLITKHKDEKITNFEAVHNSLLVYYQSGTTEILYTKDLLFAFQYQDLEGTRLPLRLIQTIPSDDMSLLKTTKSAKTNLNSLLMVKQRDETSNILMLS
jgi:hypothetical protein